jgi:hypothetical protein
MGKYLLLAAVAGLCAGCGGAPPPFKAVVDNKLLMQVIEPSADLIWGAVKTINTSDGDQHIQPKTEEEWTIVRNAAITVAESGNLMMMAPRAKNGGDWMQKAQEMIAAGEAAIRAAEGRNVDRLFTAGGDIYEACSNCHEKYKDAIVNTNK